MSLKSQNFNRFMRIHRWLGVFLAVHILLLAITGIFLVFRHELADKPELLPPAPDPVSLQSVVNASLVNHPGDRLLAIAVDHDDSQRVTLRLGQDGSTKFRGARRLNYDLRTGELQSERGDDKGWMQTFLILHRELFLGTYGKLYVGFLGLLYAFLLISGLILYGPLMKRMSFGRLRGHLNPRLWWSDLHKYLGALTFAWSLVIGLSGFLLGWGGPIIKFYQASALKGLHHEFPGALEDRPVVAVDTALETARANKPNGHFSFVSFPGSEFSTAHHYIFVMEGSTPLTERLSDLVVVNAYSGQVERILDLPLYLQLLLLAEPLHFGDYGGLPLKILWVVFGLFSMVLPLSGLWVFLRKFFPESRNAGKFSALWSTEVRRNHRPYRLPLMLMLLSWTGLITALVVDGAGDHWATLSLGSAVLLSLWFFYRNNRVVSSD